MRPLKIHISNNIQTAVFFLLLTFPVKISVPHFTFLIKILHSHCYISNICVLLVIVIGRQSIQMHASAEIDTVHSVVAACLDHGRCFSSQLPVCLWFYSHPWSPVWPFIAVGTFTKFFTSLIIVFQWRHCWGKGRHYASSLMVLSENKWERVRGSFTAAASVHAISSGSKTG